MVARTRSSSLPPDGNPRAAASVVVGLVAVAVVPLGVVLARYSVTVTLLNSAAGSVPAAVLLGSAAIVLARRGREHAQRTLGRSGGETAARVGRWLGIAGLCVGLAAALALGFFGLLTLFAS